MDKPITSMEDFAAMINTRMASKEDTKAFEERVNARFEGVESRLGRIENLKTRVKRIEEAVAV